MITASNPGQDGTNSSIGAIADAAYRVRELLLASDECDDEEIKSFTTSQLGRFNLWSSNIGVFTARHASLDYRLRTAPTVAVAVLGNLEILCRQILEILNNGASLVDEDLDELSEKPLKDLNGWAKSVIRRRTGGHIAQLPVLDSMSATITTLHRLSLSIRKASERNSLGKARTLVDYDEAYELIHSHDAGCTQDTLVQGVRYDISNEFQNFVSHVLRTRWMAGSEGSALILSLDDPRQAFLQRCVQAICTRRQEFTYFESHRDKLSREVISPTSSPGIKNLEIHAVAPRVALTEDLPASVPVGNDLVPSDTVPSEFRQASFIPAMSEILPITPVKRAPSSVVSSEGGVLRDTGWFEVPPPPTLEPNETEKMCPYCALVLPQQTFQTNKRAKKWRNHLLEDLKPYVCLYRNCSLGPNGLRTFSEWQKHIELPHDDSWTCPLHQNYDAPYSTESPCFYTLRAFRDHLSTEHAALDEIEVRELLHSARTLAELSKQCPVCLQEPSSKQEFHIHVARHLESAFVLALPWRNDLDDEDSASTRKNASATTKSQRSELDDEDTADAVESGHGAQRFSAQLMVMKDEYRRDQSILLETWTETLHDADKPFNNEFAMDSGTTLAAEPDMAQLHEHSTSTVPYDSGSGVLKTTSNPFRKFRWWADEHAVDGLTSERKAAKYLPHSVQYQYWNPTAIREILQPPLFIISAEDLSDYICIFSTLVYMEANGESVLHYLDDIMRRGYDDASLPWSENLNGRHNILGSTDDLQKFVDTQWMFYAIPAHPFLAAHPSMPSRVFMPNGRAKSMHNRLVHAKHIFPITEIRDGQTDATPAIRRVTVALMKVHSPSTEQQLSTGSTIVVFKNYPPEYERDYEDECRGYTTMREAKSYKNILQCLGSFHYITESGDRFSTIMLELADSGTLRDLFSVNRVPDQLLHVRAMWESFVGALHGVATIHNRNSPKGYLCFHHDLKPSNFFLFPSKDESEPFSYLIKIGDFGGSHSRPVDPAMSVESIPSKGKTRTYGPPETYLGDMLDFRVESSVDMWAIGCILIEMAVWITGGKLALDDFHRARMDETEGLKQHVELGQNDCFHDGSDVLSCVKGVVQLVDKNRWQHDDITPRMVELALEHVLIGENERATSQQLIPKMLRVLRDSKESTVPSETDSHTLTQRASSDVTTPPSSRLRQSSVEWTTPLPVATSPFPFVGIRELEEWANLSKTQAREIPGRKEMSSLLEGRHFIFLIDDSRHTKAYAEQIKIWTTCLTYLVKTWTPDGIDVANTSAPHAGKKIKTKTDMLRFVNQTFSKLAGSDCMIERALDMILDTIKAKWRQPHGRRNGLYIPRIGQRDQTSRGVTVLVFTNGIWDSSPDGTCGAERPIWSLIEFMRNQDMPRTQVSIQFVRLGDDERGRRRLHTLVEKTSEDFDIIDTKPVTASIWDVLIGPMHAGRVMMP